MRVGPDNGFEWQDYRKEGLAVYGTNIIDVTPIPHNGCRPPKKRRV